MTLQLLPVMAGLLLIVGGLILAFRQSMSTQIVLVLALGAVLAGVSGVQFQFNEGGMSATIGQLKSAGEETTAASDQLAAANQELASELAALNQRVNQLQASIQSRGATPPPPTVTWNPARVNNLVASSQRLTASARSRIGSVR